MVSTLELKLTIKNTTKSLLEMGYNWEFTDNFWNEVIAEANEQTNV